MAAAAGDAATVWPWLANVGAMTILVVASVNALAVIGVQRARRRRAAWRRLYRLSGGLMATEFLVVGLMGAATTQVGVAVICLPTALLCGALLEHERRSDPPVTAPPPLDPGAGRQSPEPADLTGRQA